MKNRKSQHLSQIIGLAAVAGIRTMTAPALLSHYLKSQPSKKLQRTNLRFMQTRQTATIFKLLAVGELIGDKLPMTPNRTEPGGLVGRGMSGALVGATLARKHRGNYLAGAGIGLISALASTYISFHLRKKLTEETPVPGLLWGGLEDVLAVQGGQKLLGK